jgi:hypothetical protein
VLDLGTARNAGGDFVSCRLSEWCVPVALFNVDRLDRVTLEFQSNAIEEPVLEDLMRLIRGRDSAFLLRAPLAELHR